MEKVKNIDDKNQYVVGIDFGKTKILGTVVSQDGKKIGDQIQSATELSKGKERILENLFKVIKKLLKKSKVKISGVGIGAPSKIDQKTNFIYPSPNFPFKSFNLKKEIQEKFNLPVFIDNDANVAAIGEAWQGSAKNVKDFILLTLGTSVGGAIYINGKLYRGIHSFAGEFASMKIADPKTKFPDDLSSTVRYFCGGKMIKQRYKRNLEDIIQYKDKKSRTILKEYQQRLFESIENIRHIFDPEIVVLTGSITNSWNKVIKPIKFNLPVKPGKLGNLSGAIGVAKLVFDNIKHD